MGHRFPHRAVFDGPASFGFVQGDKIGDDTLAIVPFMPLQLSSLKPSSGSRLMPKLN